MTPQQSKLLSFLVKRIDDPVCPTFEEMRVYMGQASKSGINRMVRSLVEQGRVTYDPRRARSIRAVRANRFDGVGSADMIRELQRRGHDLNATLEELLNGR